MEGVTKEYKGLEFMEEKTNKIQRSAYLIKALMAFVVFVQAAEFYQSNVFDFGAIAGTAGVLSLCRGLLLSPSLLITPIKYWFKLSFVFSKDSYKYFALGFILILVSMQ